MLEKNPQKSCIIVSAIVPVIFGMDLTLKRSLK